jgi:hypothetical protein
MRCGMRTMEISIDMKRQKKYQTREMILKDIDRAVKKREGYRREASVQDAAHAAFSKLASEGIGGQVALRMIQANEARDEANRLWDSAKRIDQTRLPKLQRTLAAFDTQPMFGDEQTVLQAKS